MGILSLIVTVKIAQTFSNDLWMETSGDMWTEYQHAQCGPLESKGRKLSGIRLIERNSWGRAHRIHLQVKKTVSHYIFINMFRNVTMQ
jgi:hypothetical protein